MQRKGQIIQRLNRFKPQYLLPNYTIEVSIATEKKVNGNNNLIFTWSSWADNWWHNDRTWRKSFTRQQLK